MFQFFANKRHVLKHTYSQNAHKPIQAHTNTHIWNERVDERVVEPANVCDTQLESLRNDREKEICGAHF